jgi:hypothetical protein
MTAMWRRWAGLLRRRPIDSLDVPNKVVEAANDEAWRRTGFGGGGRSIDLRPADCERLTEKDFRCVAELEASHRGPTVKFDMDIELTAGGEVLVSKVTRSELPQA